MLPLVVSFYTDDWDYPAHAERFRFECHNLKLRHRVDRLDSAGGYLQNCRMKPFFIRECLKEEKAPILWVDVDGSILRKPVWFDGLDADFAARLMPDHRARTWHVGTMWFNYTPKALAFIDKWCELTGELSDESALDDAWNCGADIESVNIPDPYFRICNGFTVPKSDTVILHRLSKSPSKIEYHRKAKGC